MFRHLSPLLCFHINTELLLSWQHQWFSYHSPRWETSHFRCRLTKTCSHHTVPVSSGIPAWTPDTGDSPRSCAALGTGSAACAAPATRATRATQHSRVRWFLQHPRTGSRANLAVTTGKNSVLQEPRCWHVHGVAPQKEPRGTGCRTCQQGVSLHQVTPQPLQGGTGHLGTKPERTKTCKLPVINQKCRLRQQANPSRHPPNTGSFSLGQEGQIWCQKEMM